MTKTNPSCSAVALAEPTTAPSPGAEALTIVCDARITPETVLAVLAEYDALDSTLAGQLADLLALESGAEEPAGAEDAESVAAVLARVARQVPS